MSARIIIALVIVIIVIVVFYLFGNVSSADTDADDASDVNAGANTGVNTGANTGNNSANTGNNAGATTPVKAPSLTPIQVSALNAARTWAKSYYDSLQAAAAQLQKDAAVGSSFRSLLDVYANNGLSSKDFAAKANAAVAIINQIINVIATPGCTSQCGYYTMLMDTSISPSALRQIASAVKNIPDNTTLQALMTYCIKIYSQAQLFSEGLGAVTIDQFQEALKAIPNYDSRYYEKVDTLASNLESLVENVTSTGQYLATVA